MEEKGSVLTLCVPGRPDASEAGRLVRALLAERGGAGAVEVEILPGRRETLLLVHPARGVYIDRRAAAFLLERLS